MNKVLRAAIRTMSRHQGDMTKDYGNVCANLSERIGYKVVSVNYRLAPEHRFPQGLEDCYEAMQAVLAHCEDWYQAKQEDIVIMGDSAGGEICAELGMMARDRGGLMPKRQVLPDTLLVTMEYDPLRDEGEALGEKMREAGCSVKSVRVLDGIHGMMLLPPIFAGAKEIYEAIEGFIGKRGQSEDEAVKIDALTENEVPSDKNK